MLNRWAGDSVCIIASGPSLTRADADYARLAARRVIVINESWRICPKADVLYAADAAWWRGHAPSAEDFTGERWISARNSWGATPRPSELNVVLTKQGADYPTKEPISEGANSGFQALGLATLWGARKIVLLGFDMGNTGGMAHWHGNHTGGLSNPNQYAFAEWVRSFNKIAPEFAANGVDVVNASRQTLLTCFPRKVITDALP